MNQVKITARLCGNENELTFKEKFEIARLLEKLCVDVIEFPALSGNKEDALLIRTCASFIKNSVLSVPVLSAAQADEAAACLSGANNAALRVELSVSPVGMEYFHHRKAPKMLELIKELVSYAASKAKKVYFCALDATRAEEEFLKSALLAAEEAGAKAVYLSDDAGEMLPDEFALFAEKFGKVVGVPIGVAVSNKSGFALSSAVLAVRKGVKAVKTVLSGDGISLQAFANCIKNSGARNGIALGVTYTELNRIIARVNGISDGGEGSAPSKAELGDAPFVNLDENDNKEAVTEAAAKLGYDLSNEDQTKVYEEFLRVANKKKRVGAKELDAIIASAALQVPATYKLVSYVINNGNIIHSSAQIALQKGNETLAGISMGNGPIDAAFLCLESILGTHYELDDFEIQSVTEGKEAMGSALVKLRKDGKLYSGKGISTDIIGASIRAYLSAANKIAYEEE
ncbi:MAG: hypothetical protein K5753_01935 [Clostridia bacterium]|nr:hypothetical protein [Clostridia bacterium]